MISCTTHKPVASLPPIVNPTPEVVSIPSPSVEYKVYGMNFGPYIDGQDPNFPITIPESQFRNRLDIISPYTEWIRAFSTTNGFEKLGSICRELGLKYAATAWLSKDISYNEKEISGLITAIKANEVDIAIVGSEVLLRGDLSEAQLVEYINRVKRETSGVLVTTADIYGELMSHPWVVSNCDIVFANIYPYWEGISVDNAIESLDTLYMSLQYTFKKEIIISETGWPSAGDTKGNAVASLENACKYFIGFVSWARQNYVNYFYFGAFDESWKATHEGLQGSNWGIFDKNGVLKIGMQDVFDGKTVFRKPPLTVATIPEPTSPPPAPNPKPTISYDTNLPNLYLKDITNTGEGWSGVITTTLEKYAFEEGSHYGWCSTYFDLEYENFPKVWKLDNGHIVSFAYRYEIFEAKGAKGGEQFRCGLAIPPTCYKFDTGLTTEWQTIVIDLSNRNPEYIYQVGFEIGPNYTKNTLGASLSFRNVRFSNNLPISPYTLLDNHHLSPSVGKN